MSTTPLFFRALSNLHSQRLFGPVRDLFVDRSVADQWLERYEERLLQSETRAHDEREYADAEA